MLGLINYAILAVEFVLLGVIISYIKGHKKIEDKYLFLSMVFGINLIIYSIPALYEEFIVKSEQSLWLNLVEGFSATVKSFVGEFAPLKVVEYAKIYPLYILIFVLGAALAVLTSFCAAISLFGSRFKNRRQLVKKLKGKSCDIVLGNSADALEYARKNPCTVLMPNMAIDKEYSKSLMEDGYTLLKRNFTVEFLNSSMFNSTTRYNIVYPGNNKEFFDVIGIFLSYLETATEKKNIYLYAEVDESIAETVQDRITHKTKAERKNYREYITVFSKNELMARNFVEQNPVTRYMPEDFLEKDKSMKANAEINVFVLGFGSLNREIYKQFVINNQFAVNKDGEYKVFPLNYYIYDRNIDKNDWYIGGIERELKNVEKNADEYFPVPEMPYTTMCIEGDGFSPDCIEHICDIIAKDGLNYNFIIIDEGDIYRNIKIGKELRRRLYEYDNYHIFIRNGSKECDCDCVTGCYGDTGNVLLNDIIVNETIIELAKKINQKHAEKDPTKRLRTTEENWKDLSYLHAYNSIYLANALRLKLNLLGLDYVMDGKGKGIEKIAKNYRAHFEGETDTVNIRQALLAQEHFRWNAYHLMLGYRPMEKKWVTVEGKTSDAKSSNKMDYIKDINKLPEVKKHSCITTFNGVGEVSAYLAQKANELYKDKEYSERDFDYYKNDEMLFEVAPEFLKQKNCSVINKI